MHRAVAHGLPVEVRGAPFQVGFILDQLQRVALKGAPLCHILGEDLSLGRFFCLAPRRNQCCAVIRHADMTLAVNERTSRKH
jgi:hypothetical protein